MEDRNLTIKTVIKTAWPVLVELFLGTLFGMIDMMMLGRIVNPKEAAASIASVGITNQMVFITLSLVQALNVGATAMVARYVGGNREDEIESVVRHVLLLTQALIVLPMLILGLRYGENIMKFLGAQSDTIQYGSRYFRIIVIGLVFQAFNFSMYAVLRGSGDTKTPMNINLRVNFLNVIGNRILIYGLGSIPRLGVFGAGLSTSFSQLVASLLLIKKILKKETIIKINLRERFRFNKNIMYNLVKIGIPASFEQIVIRVGIIIFTRIVSSLGTVAYATHQICLNILSLSFVTGQALGIAASSLTGRSLGAGNKDMAEEYIKVCNRIGSVLSGLIGLIFFVFGSQIIGLYTKNPEVIARGAKLLKIIALVQPFQSSQLVTAGGLRGAGDTVWPLISMIVTILFLRVSMAKLFVERLGMGLIGAWYAIFIDQSVRWAIIKYRFKTNKWKNIKIR